jgi:hypothetical protein
VGKGHCAGRREGRGTEASREEGGPVGGVERRGVGMATTRGGGRAGSESDDGAGIDRSRVEREEARVSSAGGGCDFQRSRGVFCKMYSGGCGTRVPPTVLARSCESKREELLRTLTRRCVAAPTFGQLAPVDLSPSCCQKSQMPVGLRGFGFLVESKITWNLGSMRARGQPWSVAN